MLFTSYSSDYYIICNNDQAIILFLVDVDTMIWMHIICLTYNLESVALLK